MLWHFPTTTKSQYRYGGGRGAGCAWDVYICFPDVAVDKTVLCVALCVCVYMCGAYTYG